MFIYVYQCDGIWLSFESPVCARVCVYDEFNSELLAACSLYCKPTRRCQPSHSRTSWSMGVSVEILQRKSNEIRLQIGPKRIKGKSAHLPTTFWDRPVAPVPFAGIDRGNRWIPGLDFCVRGVVPVPCWYARAEQRMTWFLAQVAANFR